MPDAIPGADRIAEKRGPSAQDREGAADRNLSAQVRFQRPHKDHKCSGETGDAGLHLCPGMVGDDGERAQSSARAVSCAWGSPALFLLVLIQRTKD